MINGIVGLMNSGKTLDMTLKLYLAYKKGKTVISNYNLSFPHKLINKDYIIYIAERERVFKNIAIGLDELWIWLDCRKSQANTVATYFFNQSSKDDTEIYFTAQWLKQIDVRMRQNLHRITQCSRVILENNKFKPISEEIRFLSPYYQNILYIKTIDFKRVTFGNLTQLAPQKPRYIKAKPIFGLFDTTQKILSK